MKLDISSENLNRAIDAVTNFLGLILKPGAKEIGLLLEDKVRSRRVLNQVDILLKVKDYVEKRGLNVTAIPLKILVPLLENGSLEEDEKLQDLWAKMLTNMLDSEQNLQNHVFPHILSQISIDDYEELCFICEEEKKLLKLEKLTEELFFKEATRHEREDGSSWYSHFNKSKEYLGYEAEIKRIRQYGFEIYTIPAENLKRLGLIKQLPPTIEIAEFRTGGSQAPNMFGGVTLPEEWHKIDAEYSDENGYRITELGNTFMEVCTLKEVVA